MARRLLRGLVAALAAVTLARAGSRDVKIDAKDVPLPEVVKLLAAQGGPSLAVHPDLAERKVTFAAKAMGPGAALRWLCRTCNLAVFEAKDGRNTLGPPEAEPTSEKEYNVAKLVPTQEGADALVNFIRKVVFVAHPIRGKGNDGEAMPLLDAVCEKGKLKVTGTALVHREVLALLRAMSKVQPKRSMDDVRVAYQPYEIGFLGQQGAGAGPKLVGQVTLDLEGVPAHEAAWALTSAANVSFYVDPWDAALKDVKVSLKGDKRALVEVAKEFAAQLGTERCWYDDAWVFVRQDRRPLYESIEVRAYNVAGAGPFRRFLGRVAREAMKWPLGPEASGRNLPFDVEHFDDMALIAGPPVWHEGAEDFVKNGPGDVERFIRPGGPPGRPGRRR